MADMTTKFAIDSYRAAIGAIVWPRLEVQAWQISSLEQLLLRIALLFAVTGVAATAYAIRSLNMDKVFSLINARIDTRC